MKNKNKELTANQKMRIAALNASVAVQCSNNFEESDDELKNTVTGLAKSYEKYIRTGELS
jgi:hypothetical protein